MLAIKGLALTTAPWENIFCVGDIHRYTRPRPEGVTLDYWAEHGTRPGDAVDIWKTFEGTLLIRIHAESDSDSRRGRVIFLPVTETRLRDVLNGVVTARDALAFPEWGYFYLVDHEYDANGLIQEYNGYWMTNAGGVLDYLPEWGTMWSIPDCAVERIMENSKRTRPAWFDPENPLVPLWN